MSNAHLPPTVQGARALLTRSRPATHATKSRVAWSPAFQRLDREDGSARVRPALETFVNGRNCATQSLKLPGRQADEPQLPAAAEHADGIGVLPLRCCHGVGDGGRNRLAEDALLFVCEGAVDLWAGEDDERARPEVEVRADVSRGRVVLIAHDRSHLLLERIETGEARPSEHLTRASAESGERVSGNNALDADRRAAKVGRSGEGGANAELPPHRTGQDADADDARPTHTREHSLRNSLLEHLLLEPVPVDQERCDEPVEARDSNPVPRAGADPGEVDLARPDVRDRVALLPELPGAPVRPDVNPHRPARLPRDLGRKALELRRLATGDLARHRQHDRLFLRLPARLVPPLHAVTARE